MSKNLMLPEITLDIDDKELQKYIVKALERQNNLSPALKKSGIVMLRSFALNFRSQGRPRAWRVLSPNTIAGRRRGSKRILQDTGRLRMSLLARTAAGNIYELRRNSLKMGTHLKIASYLQYGTKPYSIYPKSANVLRFMTTSGVTFARHVRHPGLAPRPFVLFQNEDIIDITNIFADHAVGE